MTGEPEEQGTPHPSTDEGAPGLGVLGIGEREREATLAWIGENLTQVRQTASGQRPPYWIFGVGFVAGLAAHVGGFLLKTSATAEPMMLLADLLYAFGYALWTGVVVAVFIQIWPEAKRRQYKRALDAYEAEVGRQAGVGGDRAPGPTNAEDA